jgi:hypothetical protein
MLVSLVVLVNFNTVYQLFKGNAILKAPFINFTMLLVGQVLLMLFSNVNYGTSMSALSLPSYLALSVHRLS